MSAKTPEQVKAQFRREGKTFKDFATENNFPYGEVIRVVNAPAWIAVSAPM